MKLKNEYTKQSTGLLDGASAKVDFDKRHPICHLQLSSNEAFFVGLSRIRFQSTTSCIRNMFVVAVNNILGPNASFVVWPQTLIINWLGNYRRFFLLTATTFIWKVALMSVVVRNAREPHDDQWSPQRQETVQKRGQKKVYINERQKQDSKW